MVPLCMGLAEIIDLTSISSSSEEEQECEVIDLIEERKPEVKQQSSSSYYQRAFIPIIQSALDNYSEILSTEETSIFSSIIAGLKDSAQKLFIRLFFRKIGWHRRDKLVYDDIHDFDSAVNELTSSSLCSCDSGLLIKEFLELLTLTELKLVASKLFFKVTSSMQKEEIIKNIINSNSTGQQQKISFSPKSGVMTLSAMTKNQKTELIRSSCGGMIIKITEPARKAIDTAIALHFLVHGDGSASSTKEHLSTAILAELNRVSYPKYKLNRSSSIFTCRSDYLNFQQALELEMFITETPIDDLIIDQDQLNIYIHTFNHELYNCDQNRSYFLRRFSSGWVYTRILSFIAGHLETKKEYQRAIDLYLVLLKQDLFCLGYRGKWWERCVLNNSRHLKDLNSALELCDAALKDFWLRTSALTSIKRRQKKLKKQLQAHEDICLPDADEIPETITLKGIIQAGNVTGKKVKLCLDDDELSLGSVENFVLQEFSKDNWIGVHCESSLFTTLFALLFWDILFESEVSDVFLTAYQIAPLDLNTDSFYLQRRDALEGRLKLIEEDFDVAIGLMKNTHFTNHLVSCIGVNWKEYAGEEGLQILLKVANGIGGMALSLILRQFCEDYRHNRSGMPDLILWRSTDSVNEEPSQIIDHANGVLFAEVKSPNDRLSDGQRHWFAVLKNAGLRAILVRVQAAQNNFNQ